MATLIPARAKRMAAARPMPVAEPVISALRLSSKFKVQGAKLVGLTIHKCRDF